MPLDGVLVHWEGDAAAEIVALHEAEELQLDNCKRVTGRSPSMDGRSGHNGCMAVEVFSDWVLRNGTLDVELAV